MITFESVDARTFLLDDESQSWERMASHRTRPAPMPVASQCRQSKARHRDRARKPRPKWQGAMSLLFVALTLAISHDVSAFPVSMQHIGIVPSCDPLFIPLQVDELGFPAVFPPDERIDAATTTIQVPPPCPQFNNPNLQDFVIQAVNLTTTTFTEVFYVADKETNISNIDGFANELIAGFGPTHEAFRIDRFASDPTGMHHPLLGESMIQDGLWQPGEFWRFVIQDYQNTLGLPAHLFNTLHVGDATIPAPFQSSGSIVAIPEPTGVALLGLGLAFWSLRRRS